MTVILRPRFKTWRSRIPAARQSGGSSARSTATNSEGLHTPVLTRTHAHSAPGLCRDMRASPFPVEIRNDIGNGKSLQAPELHQRTFFHAQKPPPALPADLGPPGQHLTLGCPEDLLKKQRSVCHACPEHQPLQPAACKPVSQTRCGYASPRGKRSIISVPML